MTTHHIKASELIDTVRRVAHEQPSYREETRLHLFLAAAELERLSYPERHRAAANGTEWLARYKARLILHGMLPGIADDITSEIKFKEDVTYSLNDNPEKAAENELAEMEGEENASHM